MTKTNSNTQLQIHLPTYLSNLRSSHYSWFLEYLCRDNSVYIQMYGGEQKVCSCKCMKVYFILLLYSNCKSTFAHPCMFTYSINGSIPHPVLGLFLNYLGKIPC